jgi:hypothetical protein
MINDLDGVLKKILDDANAPAGLRDAEKSFVIPKSNYAPGKPTVNLYLYDVHENRVLRNPQPIIERSGDSVIRKIPPLRVDCSYILTTYSAKEEEKQPDEEHRLLSEALLWLSRFPYIPEKYLPNEWTDENDTAYQMFPLFMLVAQMDGVKQAGEFWAAMESPPRPAITVTVTIAMDLQKAIDEGPPVVTKEIHLIPNENAASEEHWFEIGGKVTDKNTSDPIESAQIIIVEWGWKVKTNTEGQFCFSNIEAGSYTLNVTATGYITVDKPIVVPNVVPNAYDIQLST